MKKLFFNFSVNEFFVFCYLSIFIIGELNTIDRLGPQTIALNILNSLTLIWIFFSNPNFKYIFKYQGFLKLSSIFYFIIGILISMVIYFKNSINYSESIISISHYFSVFLSLFCLSVLIYNSNIDRSRFLMYVILFLSIESIYVFYSIIDYYITYNNLGNWTRTFQIRGFTGNINITAFSIAYKIPFLLYKNSILSNKAFKYFNNFILTISIINIFHLSSRGGILSLFITLIVFSIHYVFLKREIKTFFIQYSYIIIGLLISFFLLKNSSELDIVNRTASININNKDGSIDQRLRYYTEVLNYVWENPFKPIGVGIYKFKSIEFEKNNISQYIVPYHTHNDFLEILIENGIIAFLCYCLIFLSLAKELLYKIVVKNIYFYVPIFCFIIIYFFDSSLNFPIARPISFLFFNYVVAFLISEKKIK